MLWKRPPDSDPRLVELPELPLPPVPAPEVWGGGVRGRCDGPGLPVFVRGGPNGGGDLLRPPSASGLPGGGGCCSGCGTSWKL